MKIQRNAHARCTILAARKPAPYFAPVIESYGVLAFYVCLFVAISTGIGCPGGQPCDTSADCQAGEVCSEGTCRAGADNTIVSQEGVGPEGGVVEGPQGERLVIPAGALTARYPFTFEYLSSSIVVPNVEAVSRIYFIDPQITLLTDAQLEVTFADGSCDHGCYLNAGNSSLSQWSRLSETPSYPDPETGRVTFDVMELAALVVEALPASEADGGAPTMADSGVREDSGPAGDAGAVEADGGTHDGGAPALDGGSPQMDAGHLVDSGLPDGDGGFSDGGVGHDAGPVDPGPCMEDTVCAPEVCDEVTGLCVECTIDDECDEGQLCDMGTRSCYTGCSDDDDCDATEECDLFFGQCVSVTPPGCTNDLDCMANERCDMETSTCQPIVGCISSDDCMLFEECNLVTNQCESTIENPCDDTDDCETGFFCDLNLGGSCEQIGECVIDDDCTGLNEYCSPTSFLCEIELECLFHADCERGMICDFATNQCIEEPCSAEMPFDCPGELVCDVLIGRCQEAATCWDLFDCVTLPNQVCDEPGGTIFYEEPCGPDPDAPDGGFVDDAGDPYACEDPEAYCLEDIDNGVPTGEYYCHIPGTCVENE